MTPSTPNAKRLAAVVVTCNRLEHLKTTTECLLQTPDALLAHIVIVNNASQDGTEAYLDSLSDPRLLIHHSRENLGGAGGFETGMRLAAERFDPEWTVVMDDDARPEAGAIAAFHAQPRESAHAWAAAVYHPDGRICDMNRPSLNPFWHWSVMRKALMGGGRDGFHLKRSDYESGAHRDIDGTSFVGFFISRTGLELGGFPDGKLFLYGDDVLYTLSLSKLGGRIVFAPEIRFTHAFSSQLGDEKRFRPLWKSYYHYRNLLFVYRMASGPFSLAVLPAAAFKWLARVISHKGERRIFLRYVLRAISDGLLNRTDVSHDEILKMQDRP